MLESKLVSVLIPSYNHQNYIKTCLQSILNQTYKNLELIIIDDFSTDNTALEIENFLPNFTEKNIFVKFIKNEANLGLQKSLCKAKQYINGFYLFPIASDDFIENNTIEILVKTFEEDENLVLAVGKNYFVDENNKIFYLKEKEQKTYDKNSAKIFSFDELILSKRPDVNFNSPQFGSYESLLKGNYIPNGFLIKKSAFDAVGGYSEIAKLEDWFLVLQLAKIGNFKFNNNAITYYRKHYSSTSNNFDWMNEAKKQTYLLEHQKAIEFGKEDLWKKYKDYEKIISIFGIKILHIKKTFQKTVVKFFGISLFKCVVKGGKNRFYFLNIPIFSKNTL